MSNIDFYIPNKQTILEDRVKQCQQELRVREGTLVLVASMDPASVSEEKRKVLLAKLALSHAQKMLINFQENSKLN